MSGNGKQLYFGGNRTEEPAWHRYERITRKLYLVAVVSDQNIKAINMLVVWWMCISKSGKWYYTFSTIKPQPLVIVPMKTRPFPPFSNPPTPYPNPIGKIMSVTNSNPPPTSPVCKRYPGPASNTLPAHYSRQTMFISSTQIISFL